MLVESRIFSGRQYWTQHFLINVGNARKQSEVSCCQWFERTKCSHSNNAGRCFFTIDKQGKRCKGGEKSKMGKKGGRYVTRTPVGLYYYPYMSGCIAVYHVSVLPKPEMQKKASFSRTYIEPFILHAFHIIILLSHYSRLIDLLWGNYSWFICQKLV